MYLLDTNICVFFLRGKLDLFSILKEKKTDQVYISIITAFELRYGAENSPNPDKSHKAVDVFLKGVTTIDIAPCVDKYAKEKTRLKRLGTPVHDDFDLLIGATALTNDLILVTDNTKDFKSLKGIRLENWMKR
jgi:tRNA(fMet)-specific endonuclease VapC